MKNKQFPIGVFDSGMGGLTVLKALRQSLPCESFIYLGDTARLPYGTKSIETVRQYAAQMARVLVEKQIKALVIACNTATTAALDYLQDMLPELVVIGVVEPGAEAAIEATRNAHIAVIATQTTIASNAYQQTIRRHLPHASIHATAGSVLVALAEEGMTENAVAREALKHYLSTLEGCDTLLLGCTHFPVFKPLLASMLPQGVAVVDSALATARALKSRLADKALLVESTKSQPTKYLVTDSIDRFAKVGEIFLEQALSAAHIELIDAGTPKI